MNVYRVLLPVILLADAVLLGWLIQAYGNTVEAWLLFTRYSARVSFLVFLPVFTASAWQTLMPSRTSALLLRHRRQWGLSFAFAHTLHMIGIIVHYRMRGEWFTADDAAALVIYTLVYLMAITSNNRSVRRLGKGWKWLHKVGIYAIFVGYWVTYLGRLQSEQVSLAAGEPAHEWFAVYLVLALLVNAAWLMRIVAFWKKRADRQPSGVPASG